MLTGDPELLRTINRFHVLDTIRRHEPISRGEIGEKTRLSRGTVSSITAALLDEGLIKADESDDSEPAMRGRPRSMLRMNPDAAFVVGVKLAPHQVSVMVTNLKADVLVALTLPVRIRRLSAESVADLVEDAVRASISRAGIGIDRISGVGVGVPGYIDAAHGISLWSPVLDGRDVPFASLLSHRLGLPVQIENDANLATMAERWFGHGQGVDNFIVVSVEHGVGMGLFVNGELYRGAHGLGAEFGHSKLSLDGPACRCGQRGCVEAYVADYAILRDAEILLGPLDRADVVTADRAIRHVTDLAKAGHPELRTVFQRAGTALGVGVANLVNVLDPTLIVLAGAGTRAGDLLMGPLEKALRANALPVLRDRFELRLQEWTDEVWARGAAALVLERIYRAPWSRAESFDARSAEGSARLGT